MEPSIELTRQLAKITSAKTATTFYVNGAPGSGKTHLLNRLGEQLPIEIPRSVMLGPYAVADDEIAALGQRIATTCLETGFIEPEPAYPTGSLDLAETWLWLQDKLIASNGLSLFVLIDLTDHLHANLTALTALLSIARSLENRWEYSKIRLHHIIVGCWDPPALERSYRQASTSFPYTLGHNYRLWTGLDATEMSGLLKHARPQEFSPLLGRLLNELTGGHPRAALEILDAVPPGKLSVATLLAATRATAQAGATTQMLLTVWQTLDPEARSLLRALVMQRHVATFTSPASDTLLAAGIARMDRIGKADYISFRAWFAELIVRQNLAALALADDQTTRIRIDELTPDVSEFSLEAYRLIYDLENAARNFVAAYLCQHTANQEPLLAGHLPKTNQKNISEDAHTRAADWRQRALNKKLTAESSPSLTYLSTRELAELLWDIGIALGSDQWKQIARALDDLAPVRDVVMHNQIIDDHALERIYTLQAAIYAALSKPG